MDIEVNRRKLMKILVTSGGALVASTMIPGKWLKPAVEMGVLPAHAQLSGPTFPLSSSPRSLSTTNNAGDSGDDIYITFDGASNLQLVATGDLDPTPPNALIGIDTDPGLLTWESYNSGSNWTITNTGGLTIPGGPNAGATYTIVVDGFGDQFQLTFSVAVSGNPPTGTVSGVTIEPTP